MPLTLIRFQFLTLMHYVCYVLRFETDIRRKCKAVFGRSWACGIAKKIVCVDTSSGFNGLITAEKGEDKAGFLGGESIKRTSTISTSAAVFGDLFRSFLSRMARLK
jgi:hypothetical protein